MNHIIAERTGRTVAELLESIGQRELADWYAHLALEADERAAALERASRR